MAYDESSHSFLMASSACSHGCPVHPTDVLTPHSPPFDPQEKYWKDNWTAVTTDGSLTAQFEHTILITKDGYEILTLP